MSSAYGKRDARPASVTTSNGQGAVEQSDAQLAALCRAQLPYNTTAYEALVRRYEGQVFGSCIRYLGNPSDAEDACQETFLRVFHNIEKFEGRSSFRTWLFRIVANICATHLSKARADTEKQRAYLHDVNTGVEGAYGSGLGTDFGEGIVAAAFEQLSRPDKSLLLLRHVFDLSVPEISETLKLKLSAAKMRISRAEQRLRVLCDGVVDG